ncbi:MAG: vitamin B12 dependent-methionine synthase activation domain-containing protein [Elusimicrobiota bacterium]
MGVKAVPIALLLPTKDQVLSFQGVVGRATPKAAAVAQKAVERLGSLAAPVSVVEEVSAEEFSAIFQGEGLNEKPNPLEAVFFEPERVSLFAVTLGEPVCAEIGRLFGAGDYPLASALDAAASFAADRAAAWVEGQAEMPGLKTLRYSPGYCGWHLSGQKSLFKRLKPESIGIRLNDSCLMSPIKSVSGVVVSAEASKHSVKPGYAFCKSCRNKTCVAR